MPPTPTLTDKDVVERANGERLQALLDNSRKSNEHLSKIGPLLVTMNAIMVDLREGGVDRQTFVDMVQAISRRLLGMVDAYKALNDAVGQALTVDVEEREALKAWRVHADQQMSEILDSISRIETKALVSYIDIAGKRREIDTSKLALNPAGVPEGMILVDGKEAWVVPKRHVRALWGAARPWVTRGLTAAMVAAGAAIARYWKEIVHWAAGK